MGSLTFDGVIIFCADVEASARFYEGGLGLTRSSEGGDVILHLPTKGKPKGAWLLLHPRTGEQAPHPIGTFTVEDVDTTIEKLRAGGYRITEEPTDQPWGVREAGVADPDGYGLTLTAPLGS